MLQAHVLALHPHGLHLLHRCLHSLQSHAFVVSRCSNDQAANTRRHMASTHSNQQATHPIRTARSHPPTDPLQTRQHLQVHIHSLHLVTACERLVFLDRLDDVNVAEFAQMMQSLLLQAEFEVSLLL